MKPKTTQQVAAEIAALKALKPVGQFTKKTKETIEIQIEALEHGMDETAPEWEELSEEQQMAAMDATTWKEGGNDEAPSKGFGNLCA